MRVAFLILASVAAIAGCGPQGPSQADIMAGRDGTEEGTPPGQAPLYSGDSSSNSESSSTSTPNAIPTPYGASGSSTPGGPPPAMTPQYGLSVVLTGYGDRKLSVIQAVMAARPDLGLADAKALVESAPQPIRSGLSAADATALKASLEAAGGSVRIN